MGSFILWGGKVRNNLANGKKSKLRCPQHTKINFNYFKDMCLKIKLKESLKKI